MSNTWSVYWEGDQARSARGVLSRLAPDGVVRCGTVGALWRVNWEQLSDGRVSALLIPVDVHEVSPVQAVTELLTPNTAL